MEPEMAEGSGAEDDWFVALESAEFVCGMLPEAAKSLLAVGAEVSGGVGWELLRSELARSR